MMGAWVAASVRARTLAHARLGAGAARDIARATTKTQAIEALRGTMYSSVLQMAEAEPALIEHEVGAVALWRLRVLAGWAPPGGARLLRAVAMVFERENLMSRVRQLYGSAESAAPDYELGGLVTGRLLRGPLNTIAELCAALGSSPWGDPRSSDPATIGDVLTVVAWRRLADTAPVARPWACGATALLAARLVLVERAAPSERLTELAAPLIGRDWQTAATPDAFRSALPPSVRSVLDGVGTPAAVWLAQLRWIAEVDRDAARMLRTEQPSPDVVLAAAVRVIIDGWRLRAALAAADDSEFAGEFFDALA